MAAKEKEYIDLFANPFPAGVRGKDFNAFISWISILASLPICEGMCSCIGEDSGLLLQRSGVQIRRTLEDFCTTSSPLSEISIPTVCCLWEVPAVRERMKSHVSCDIDNLCQVLGRSWMLLSVCLHLSQKICQLEDSAPESRCFVRHVISDRLPSISLT